MNSLFTLTLLLAESPPRTSADVALDAALVLQARHNAAAFSALYERHEQRTFRYIMARVHNQHDAEDLTTQTFMAALTGLNGFRGEGAFGAWLVGIARRQIALHFRRRQPVVGDEILEQLGSGDDEDPEAAVDQHALLLRVLARLDRLPPERAEVIRLRFFAGLETPEIARLLGKQEPAVRMLLSRGLRDLQTAFANVPPDSPISNYEARQ